MVVMVVPVVWALMAATVAMVVSGGAMVVMAVPVVTAPHR